MAELSSFIPALVEKTRDNKLQWQELGKGSYYTTLDDMVLVLTVSAPSAKLQLRNKEDVLLETVSFPFTQSEFDVLSALYETIRRQTLGVDEALEKARRALDKI